MTATAKRVLVVEDDASIAMGLRMNLVAEGYEVVVASDGADGLERAREGFDLIVLDLMLPKLNGYEVIRILREEKNATPLLVLSARTSEVDIVAGLDLGAEDYMTKPFALAELLARVRGLLRRSGGPEIARWTFGNVEVDVGARVVTRGGADVDLTTTEFDLLQALIASQGGVLSRDQIFDLVWGSGRHGTRRTIDNFVAQLRAKLENDPAEPKHLLTVRGVGYRIAGIEPA